MSRKAQYHPSEYKIPASDSRGHSAYYQFRAPESWGRRMEEVVQSRQFPFDTVADIHRWCWVTGMQELERLKPECTDLSQEMAAMRVVRDVEDQQRYQSIFYRVEKVIDQAIEDHDESTARGLIADLRFSFEAMPDGPTRTRYLEKLTKWDYLLAPEKGTSPLNIAPPKRVRRPKVRLEDGE